MEDRSSILNRGTRKQPSNDPIQTELEGYTALGMHKDALRLARKILRNPDPSTVQFETAIVKVLHLERRLRRIRGDVENAYAQLNNKGQRHVRCWMFFFYYSAGEFVAAIPFMPKRFNGTNGMLELTFAWDIWTSLGDEESLEKHFNSLVACAETALNPFMRGTLFARLGDYCLRKGCWRAAMKNCGQITVESGCPTQAVLGPLLALSGELLASCDTARQTLDRFKRADDDCVDEIPPRNDRHKLRKIERRLVALERGLARAIGTNGMKQLATAIQASGRHENNG